MWSKLWKPASSVLGTLWSKPPRPCHHNSQLEIILRFWKKKIVIFLSQKIESLLSLMHQLRVFDNTARQQNTTSLYNKHQPKWLARKCWWTNWNHDLWSAAWQQDIRGHQDDQNPACPWMIIMVCAFFKRKPSLCQTLVQNLVAYFFWEQLDVLPLCSDGSD